MSSIKTHPYDPTSSTQQHYAVEEEISVNATVVDENAPFSSSSQQHQHEWSSTGAPTVIHQPGTAMIENPKYVQIDSREPVTLSYCPNCAKEHVMTTTRTKPTGPTWLCVGAGLFIFWPLCWVPLLVRPLKQTNHYCPSCGKKVGRVKAFQ